MPLQTPEVSEPVFPLSGWLQFGGEGGRLNTGGAHHIQLLSSFAPPPMPTTLIFFFTKTRNKLDRRWRPDQQAGKSWIPDFPSEKHSAGTPSRATGWPEICRPLCHVGVGHVCECLYVVSPGKCQAHGWVQGGRLWVGCG